MKIGQQKLTHPSRVQSIGGCGHMTTVSMDMMQSQNAAAKWRWSMQTQSVVTLKDVLDADSQIFQPLPQLVMRSHPLNRAQ